MIRIEQHPGTTGPFAEVVIDRPDKRNALTTDMLALMSDAADTLAGDRRFRALVVRGEGRAFCSGFDLAQCLDDPARLAAMLRGLSRLTRALRRFPAPVVIAVHGAAVAGGCAIACAGDLVVVDRSAKLGYPVVKLGISPAVNAPLLAMNLRGSRCRERLLDPGLITGEEARRVGLAHVCVDLPDDVIPRAQTEAMKLAAKPPWAVARTKAWLNEMDGSADDAALDKALEASLSLVGSDEQRALLNEALGGTGPGAR